MCVSQAGLVCLPTSGYVGGSEFVIHDSENGETIRTLKLLDDARFSDDWSA